MEKWFVFSRRLWGTLLVIAGSVLPIFGVDVAPGVLEGLGTSVAGAFGGFLALWSAFRPDNADLTPMP